MTNRKSNPKPRKRLNTITPIKEIDGPFFLRLYGFTLTAIRDESFFVVFLAALRKKLKKDTSPQSIIRHTISNGAAYFLASVAFDHFLSTYGDERLLENHGAYATIHLMQDILEAWFAKGQNYSIDNKYGKQAGLFMWDCNHEKDIEKLVEMLDQPGRTILRKIIKQCERDPLYPSMRHAYALEIADRLIHDRQISAYIAEQLVWLAPRKVIVDDDFEDEIAKQFCYRKRWPAFVRPLLIARDRGKCANCKTDITMELLANTHIDHIFALSKGGCNDIVNLQLLCEPCNKKKGTNYLSVKTSVPSYHKRYSRRTLIERHRKLRSIF